MKIVDTKSRQTPGFFHLSNTNSSNQYVEYLVIFCVRLFIGRKNFLIYCKKLSKDLLQL